jgi:glycosyltransferase involved in cell wall biosynthesis
MRTTPVSYDRAGAGGAEQRTLRGEDIVCVGFAEWNPELPTNQHHLMSRLAQTNRILFVESLGLRRPQLALSDLRRIARRLRYALRGARSDGDVTVLSPIALPAHGSRIVGALNRWLLRRQVGHAVARLGFHRPILWAYVPHAEALLETLDSSLVVYHCVDDLAAQKGIHAESFRQAERRLVTRADLVLASAPTLLDRLRRSSDAVIYAPNVADIDFFATALDKGRVDTALGRLPTPRVVFTGAIVATKVDMEWLAALARLRPAWTFALVGPVGLGDPRTDVSVLRAVPNIHLLGPRPYQLLPDVLRGADAALVPYALNALTASVFPMKVYEYIAAGLVVVSTPLPALRGLAGVTIAGDPETAARELTRLISTNTPERSRARSQTAAGHSWVDRLTQIALAVESLRPPAEPHWSGEDPVVHVEHPADVAGELEAAARHDAPAASELLATGDIAE